MMHRLVMNINAGHRYDKILLINQYFNYMNDFSIQYLYIFFECYIGVFSQCVVVLLLQ